MVDLGLIRVDLNIFSTLAKYNSAVDENYLTEAFVFLINSLLQRDMQSGHEILQKLCVKYNEFSFGLDEDIIISTQEITEQGTPDIKISTPDKLIYIEVKHDSELGYQQISRYKKALETSNAAIKRVVLLTRFSVDFEADEEKPYKHVRWFEIYNWLSEAKSELHDPISKYLIESFNSFLEEKQMTLQRVSWEYLNGVPAMINLINMIEVAIEAAGIDFYKTYPRSAAWDTKGFNLGNRDYWCGIHFNDPHLITFELLDKNKFDKNKLSQHTFLLQEGKARLWFRLPLEEIYFFSLDKDKQLEEITKFVKTCYQEAELMCI